MTMDWDRTGAKRTVILYLTSEEAAILANDCESLANAVQEDRQTLELELRRLSDRAEGKV